MSFSSFLSHGFPGMLNDDGDNNRSRFSIVDYMREIPLCCPGATTVDDCSIQETPQAGENNKHRSSTQSWKPPLYRDKSLLADASCCFVQDSTMSLPSNFESSSVVSVCCDQSTSSQQDGTCPQMPTNEDTDYSNCLRAAFIPPKHVFPLSFKRKKRHRSIESLSPKSSGLRLQPKDVVCGRGAPTSTHRGNVEFKKIIKQHEMKYICAKRNEKPKIAEKLLTTFQSDGVRFVKRERNEMGVFEWVEIGKGRAFEKVCQSLREEAPQLKRKMMAAELKRGMRAQKRGRGQYQSLQGRQDSSSSYSNDVMNDYDLRHQPSFASQQQRNSWSDEPHNISNAGRHHHDRDERMQYHHDNSEHYNHIPYCTDLLPPYLGGERLFGDRQSHRE
mmetsp:Transcript_23150/g.54656  ORF Transcript_23150/g.54656 Transcript_23150/m.54656 type:complete len:388 (-) Transcript_23150:194-1357(-)